MPLLGDADRVYFRGKEIARAYLGSKLVFGEPPVVAPSAFAVLDTYTGPVSILDGGRTAVWDSGGSGSVVNVVMGTPIHEPTYLELIVFTDSAALAGDAGGLPLPTSDGIGWIWNRPGFASAMSSGWSAGYVANYGDTGTSGAVGDPFNSQQTQLRYRVAIEPTTRAVWLGHALMPAGTYQGGGNPAAGTSPTFILQGANPIRIGGSLSGATGRIELPHPDAYTGTAPAGFVAGLRTP